MADVTNMGGSGSSEVIIADLYAMEKFCSDVLTPETNNISKQLQAMVSRLDSITVSGQGFDSTFTSIFKKFKSQVMAADDDLVSINNRLIARIEQITSAYDFASSRVADLLQELYQLNPYEFTQYERDDSQWGGNTAAILEYLEK